MGRKVQLAELYAESIFKDGEELVTLLAQDARETGAINFTTAFNRLRRIKLKTVELEETDEIGQKLRKVINLKCFPQLGDLSGYLVAADFTYTYPPLVCAPTYEEPGKIICKSTPEACARGVLITHARLAYIIDPEDQEAIRLDLVVVEHFLCKVGRAHKVSNKSSLALVLEVSMSSGEEDEEED
ncbi:hypothetical protein FB45DRAFT_1020511 [Roridomyces roridus]|uniref:Uncharacterized protein n=1 Tax=Roridomyces roridus TaxID=1738132 RepID=A0AAD7CAM2_9AGAR|nr:hypothetical protein FB45DRAFT_1020511 [Roridomyces roridus]